MKKFKKVLLSIALCLCLGFTAIYATACSGVNLSEAQTQKLLDAVDHSDQFMNDTLDLLQKSNSKMDREDAYRMLKAALIKLETNADGDWDNLKLNITQAEDGYNKKPIDLEIGLYKLSDAYSNRRAVYYDINEGLGVGAIEGHLDVESQISYADEQRENQMAPAAHVPSYVKIDKTTHETSTENNSIHLLINSQCLAPIGVLSMDITVDDIVEFKKLDSGNCVISVATIPEAYKEYDCSCYIEFEFNSNGKIVSEKMAVYMLDSNGLTAASRGQIITCDITLTYGALTERNVVNKLTAWGADFSQLAD